MESEAKYAWPMNTENMFYSSRENETVDNGRKDWGKSISFKICIHS